jgi:hypothetical protein
MSLLIDDGLVLSNTTTSDRNLIQSNGNDLIITTNNGDALLQSIIGFTFGKNCNMEKGNLHRVGEFRGSSSTTNNISAQTGYKVNLKTNKINQVIIEDTKIMFTNNPRLTSATSSTTNGQLMSMNNFMSVISYTPVVSTTNGTATLNASSYGRYCRIGNMIYITVNVLLSSLGTLEPLLGVRISLPFQSTSSTVQNLIISKLTNLDMTTITSVFDAYLYIAANTINPIIFYKKLAADSAVSTLQGNQLTNTSQIAFGGFYFI